MKLHDAVLPVLLVLGGCQSANRKVLIGGALPSIADSVIVIEGPRIQSVGARRDIAVPQDSERTDLTGKYLLPVAGARIAPGQPASLEVHDGSPGGPIVRRMTAGHWTN